MTVSDVFVAAPSCVRVQENPEDDEDLVACEGYKTSKDGHRGSSFLNRISSGCRVE